MPTIKTCGDQLASLLRRWVTPADDLRSLDARTLADIGIDPSEFDSIQTEHLGASVVTRRRIVGAVEACCHG